MRLSALLIYSLSSGHVIASSPAADHAPAHNGLTWLILFIGATSAIGLGAFFLARPRWLAQRGRPRPVSPALMFVLLCWHLLVTPALARLALWLIAAPPPGESPTMRQRSLQMIAIQTAAAVVVVLWWGLRRLPGEREWTERATRRLDEARGWTDSARRCVRWYWAVGAAILGLLLAWPIVQLTAEIAAGIQGWFTTQVPAPLAHRTLRELAAEPAIDGWKIALIAVVVLLVPLLEEVVFRGAIQGCLRSLTNSPWPGILLTSLLFGFMHLNVVEPAAVPGLVVFGIALGVVYERTGTLLAPVLMHGLFNLGNIVLMLLTAIPRQ